MNYQIEADNICEYGDEYSDIWHEYQFTISLQNKEIVDLEMIYDLFETKFDEKIKDCRSFDLSLVHISGASGHIYFTMIVEMEENNGKHERKTR